MIDAVTNVQQVDVSTIKKGGGDAPLPPGSSASKSSKLSESVSAERVEEKNLPGEGAGQVKRDGGGPVKPEEVARFVEELNAKLHSLDRETRFQLDEKIDRSYVSVVNKDTKEVIREFPPEEIRVFMAKMKEFNETAGASVENLLIDMEV